MKIIVKDSGKIVREKEMRNILHFDVQRKTRSNIVTSKKVYNRKKCKKMSLYY